MALCGYVYAVGTGSETMLRVDADGEATNVNSFDLLH